MAKLSSAELAKREDVIQKMKKNKRSLVKRYGPDAEKVMYGRATNIAKKVAESEMEKSNLKELVRAALMNEKAGFSKEYDDNPALKGGQKNLPDGLQKAIINKAKSANEDLDLGHQDNEPHMIKGELYRIGKYAMELYNMVDQFEGKGEVDFPAWWQSKITTAKNMVSSAKHYLEFELKEPEIDAMVDIAAAEDIIPNTPSVPLEDEIEENLEETRVNPNTNDRVNYLAHTLEYIWNMGKGNNSIDFKDLAKSTVGDMFGDDEDEIEEGIHDRDITSASHTNVKGEMGAYNPAKRAASLKRLANFGPKKNDDEIEEGLPKGYWSKKIEGGVDESFEKLVGKLKKGGKSEKAAKAIAGAVASYKAKGGGKGPTAKQKARG